MVAPVIALGAAALLAGARVAATAAVPVALAAARTLTTKVASVASKVATAKVGYAGMAGITALNFAGAPLAAYLDNKTDNAISQGILKTPFAGILENVLEANEWAEDQKATVVSNTIMRELEKRGTIKRDDEDYDIKKQMAEVIGHLAVGDEYGAANTAAKLGIDPSDAIEAYNRAKDQHPNASFEEQCNYVFENLIAERERKLARESQARNDADADQQRIQEAQRNEQYHEPDTLLDLDAPAVTKPTKPAVAASTPAKVGSDISGMSVSAQFEEAADNAGFFKGMIMKAASKVIGKIFGEVAQGVFQGFALGSDALLGKYAKLEKGIEEKSVFSKLGDMFNLGDDKPVAPQPHLSYDNS